MPGGRHAVRGRARRDRGRRGARVRRDPGDAPRPRLRGRVRDRATRIRRSRRRRSTGRRSPRSPARWSSTWASARCRGSPSSWSRAAAPADEPVAVVERGTLPGQRTLLATLADVAERAAEEADPRAGDHGGRAGRRGCGGQLGWLERRPLHGRTVAVTRARPQASALAARLRELGADGGRGAGDPHAAAGRRRCPTSSGFDLVCLTSPNGAHALFERLGAAGRDARALAGLTVAAIGPGTARALAGHGVRADVVPGARRGRRARRRAGRPSTVARAR